MARTPIKFTCQSCREDFESTAWGAAMSCPSCGESMGRIAQLGQLLDQWFYPRRWRADLHQPNPNYLLEKLWTANGQGESLYTGIAPAYANYDIFRNLVTRLVAQGVNDGWIELEFPDDPLEENPVYQLKFSDPDRFAQGVERLFPEVNWDEQIEVPTPPEQADSGFPDATTSVKTPTPIGAARSARRSSRRKK